MFLKSTNIVACIRIPFPFQGSIIFHSMYKHILFTYYSSIDGHLGYFYLLAIGNSAAMNMGVQISFWVPAFSSLGYIPQSGIAEQYGNSVSFLDPPYCQRRSAETRSKG